MHATRSSEDVTKSIPGVEADIATIDSQWPAYYPAGVFSVRERVVADRIASGLKDFRERFGGAISALKAGNFDVAAHDQQKWRLVRRARPPAT